MGFRCVIEWGFRVFSEELERDLEDFQQISEAFSGVSMGLRCVTGSAGVSEDFRRYIFQHDLENFQRIS